MSIPPDPLDQLDRRTYCLLGLPIDCCDLETACDSIRAAVSARNPFLVSTPNVNFLIASRDDPEFRAIVVGSELSLVDGMPLVWLARLLRLPIRERVSGSDVFDRLNSEGGEPISVCFFGGAPGVAANAGDRLNARSRGLRCVGAIDPGAGTVEDMSSDELLAEVNLCGADFLVVALGAKKGQAWLARNHHRLTAPVRAHLGAVVNFYAGTIKRAPLRWRRVGLEWLWRIRQEPQLWRRYWADGAALFGIFVGEIIPLLILTNIHRIGRQFRPAPLRIVVSRSIIGTRVKLVGDAIEPYAVGIRQCLRETIKEGFQELIIDLAETRAIDQRVMGLLMMVRKAVVEERGRYELTGASTSLRRQFRLNGAEYLLDEATACPNPAKSDTL